MIIRLLCPCPGRRWPGPGEENEESRGAWRLLPPFSLLKGLPAEMRGPAEWRRPLDDEDGVMGVRAHVLYDALSSSPSGVFRFLSLDFGVAVP